MSSIEASPAATVSITARVSSATITVPSQPQTGVTTSPSRAALVSGYEPGPPGSPGPPGPPGPSGSAGGVSFDQPIASTTWTIAHGLNRYPVVVVVDTAGDTIDPDVSYPDLNTAVLLFSAAVGGSAYLI